MRKKLPNFLRGPEADLLLQTARRLYDEARTKAKKRAAWMDWVISFTGLFMGLRVSEICKLKIEHLDLEQKSALVFEGKGGKDRYVPIPDKLAGPLKEWIGDRVSGYVFQSPRGGQLSTRTVQVRLSTLGKKAGLFRKLHPHALRHSYATILLQKGANLRELQELLGHSSVAVTERYTHIENDRLKKVANLL